LFFERLQRSGNFKLRVPVFSYHLDLGIGDFCIIGGHRAHVPEFDLSYIMLLKCKKIWVMYNYHTSKFVSFCLLRNGSNTNKIFSCIVIQCIFPLCPPLHLISVVRDQLIHPEYKLNKENNNEAVFLIRDLIILGTDTSCRFFPVLYCAAEWNLREQFRDKTNQVSN